MFRRRGNRRMLRPQRGIARSALRAPQELLLANQMMETGDYAGAAGQFESLARTDEARCGRAAPQLYLQAGWAQILAGQTAAGLVHLKHGLSLLQQRANWLRLHRSARRIISELNQLGLAREVDEISAFLNASLPGDFSAPREAIPAGKPVLPIHCPACGAAVRPDEVDWLDNLTAECAYCGSPVREEG